MEYIRGKLEFISDAEPIKRLNIRDYIHGIEKRAELFEEFIITKLIHNRIHKRTKNTEVRFLRALETYELRGIKERLENAYSLAYILRSPEPATNIIKIIGSDLTNIECRIYHHFYSFWPTENIMMYLGDLDDLSIGLALDGYDIDYVSILVPAHHGNRWHPKLSQVKAEITYLNRCDKHTQESYRRLRKGYLNNFGLILVGGHKYHLYYNF